MTLPLFFYGTLRDPDVAATVLGRPLTPAHTHAAAAPGFRTVFFPGRTYPVIIRQPGATAEGLLITDVTAFERDLLDAFEGADYRRTPIPVVVDTELFEADAYLPVAPVTLAHDWSLSRWQAEHKPKVLHVHAGTAAQLRLRLIALRPN